MSIRRTVLIKLKQMLSGSPRLFNAAKFVQVFSNYALRSVHEPDFAVFAKLPADGLFADIGANMGQSALSFSVVRPRWQIASFEINLGLESWLKQVRGLLGERFSYKMVGIGPGGQHTLYVPRRNKIEFSGEASLHKEQFDDPRVKVDVGGDYTLAEYPALTVPFDVLELTPDVVKIDVQGHELAVLQSMATTIARCNPVFIIERGLDTEDYTAFLKARGYGRYMADMQSMLLVPAGAGEHPQNYFFLNVTARPDLCAPLLQEGLDRSAAQPHTMAQAGAPS